MLIIDFLVIINAVGDIVTEQEFKYFCTLYNYDTKFIITKNKFCNKKNIIGCNNTNEGYIIYSTNDAGARHDIGIFQDELYTFKFLYLLIVNDLDLLAAFSNQKEKKLIK